jgi:CheY-like chemotaxis protein
VREHCLGDVPRVLARDYGIESGDTTNFRRIPNYVLRASGGPSVEEMVCPDCGPRPADSISGIMSEPLQILVVEDEKAVGHMIAMVLGGPASKVARARNGWEALIKIGVTARPFDVVITDHRMPHMTGLQLVRRLREQNFGGKILVLSAHLSDENIRAYEELSVDMMMTKPFDFDELQEAMAVLNKKASVLAEAYIQRSSHCKGRSAERSTGKSQRLR